jgi:hypothetical protein
MAGKNVSYFAILVSHSRPNILAIYIYGSVIHHLVDDHLLKNGWQKCESFHNFGQSSLAYIYIW